MLDQLFFEQFLKLHLRLPRNTRWVSVYVDAGKPPHVVAGYYRDDESASWWNFLDAKEPPIHIATFTLGDRMVDWWQDGGRDIGRTRATNLAQIRIRCTGTMAEWWATKGHKIGGKLRRIEL